MNNIEKAVRDIECSFDYSCYPKECLDKYTQVECLSFNNGIETFLLKERDGDYLYVAKCFSKNIYSTVNESNILKSLHHEGLPSFIDEYQSHTQICIVREYIEGKPLNQYMEEKNMATQDIVKICIELCDILIYLHGKKNPVIHRDIKPQNVIVKPDGKVVLIDFDISRFYSKGLETDTQFIGTREYAPPEQYGFSQTDARTDIYSFGVLLRYVLTGSERENPSNYIYGPLLEIIKKCTAFAPKDRYHNAMALKKALIKANPQFQRKRKRIIALCIVVFIIVLVFGGTKFYQNVTFNPFAQGTAAPVLTNEELVSDAVSYMGAKYGTDIFDDSESYADIGFVRRILTDVYGYESEYVYAFPEEGPPHESAKNFLPWGMGDEQYLPRDVMVYVAVKIYWKDIVSDYSSLKDDNGYYPGVRVAVAFAEETGILEGVARPEDITKGEVAILLANADRVFEATKK